MNITKTIPIIKEKKYGFDNDLYETIKPDSILIGYWQDENYFKKIKNKIKCDLVKKNTRRNKIKKFKQDIESSNSVSVHFRMKDYVENKKTSDFHGILSNDYYKKSFEFIKNRIENPTFFIFSDDINKVKDRIDMEYHHYFVCQNDPFTDTDELFLMSLCKHNIISNSTFSWWGGWLNKNQNKLVVGPKNWFKTKKNNPMPKGWIRI